MYRRFFITKKNYVTNYVILFWLLILHLVIKWPTLRVGHWSCQYEKASIYAPNPTLTKIDIQDPFVVQFS